MFASNLRHLLSIITTHTSALKHPRNNFKKLHKFLSDIKKQNVLCGYLDALKHLVSTKGTGKLATSQWQPHPSKKNCPKSSVA